MTPLFFITHYQLSAMSHQLPDEYWDSLGPNGPFLCELFHNQSQLVAQLQATNNDLQTQVMDASDDVANVASQAASAVAHTILTSMQMSAGGQPTRNAKASDPEPFDGSQESREQFVRSIHIAVTMQLNAFADERMKILYTLSFMQGEMAQVWVANETSVILDNMSSFSTLVELLASIKGTFSNPDWEWTACTQLHTLKLTLGMTAEEYMASFEMLATWTSFNEAAFEDTNNCGLPQAILLKVYSQTSLPSGLASRKAVVHNLDWLQRGFDELKQSIWLNQAQFPQSNIHMATPTPDTSAPMDIDQSKCKQETCTCYNCDEKGHLSHHGLKPQKQQIHSAKLYEVDIKGLVAEVVAAVMDAQDAAKKVEGPKKGF